MYCQQELMAFLNLRKTWEVQQLIRCAFKTMTSFRKPEQNAAAARRNEISTGFSSLDGFIEAIFMLKFAMWNKSCRHHELWKKPTILFKVDWLVNRKPFRDRANRYCGTNAIIVFSFLVISSSLSNQWSAVQCNAHIHRIATSNH